MTTGDPWPGWVDHLVKWKYISAHGSHVVLSEAPMWCLFTLQSAILRLFAIR